MGQVMMSSIEFLGNHRCFKAGDKIRFRGGVNLLVGDNGSGKSTVLQAIRDASRGRSEVANLTFPNKDVFAIRYLDFEKGTPRTASHFDDGVNMESQILLRFASHGQSTLALLRGIGAATDASVFLIDEPDTALSIRSCHVLVEILTAMSNLGKQVIAAVHNPIVINAFPVFDLGCREWVPGSEFIRTQGGL